MIEYITGHVAELTPATVVIETRGGVAYLLNISLNTFTATQGKSDTRLYVQEAVREDQWTLYGFATRDERTLFLLLTSVSGVGGNTARTILSAYSPAELCDLIGEGNDRLLRTVKGLGPKTAQRLIVELRDKVQQLAITPAATGSQAQPLKAINQQVHDDAVEALKALGYPPAPVAKAVRAILIDDPTATVEHVIKLAFKML